MCGILIEMIGISKVFIRTYAETVGCLQEVVGTYEVFHGSYELIVGTLAV